MYGKCVLESAEKLSKKWIERRLADGCNCTVIRDINMLMTLHCESFPFEHEIPVQMFYIFIFTAIIILALCGNFTVIWIVLCHERMRTVTNYYLLNLAISDATISIFNTGFSWTYNFYYVWIFGSTYCAISNLMGIAPICASVFTMIVMSIDRYVAIVHPLKRRLGRRATVTAILCIWILAVACGLPALLASKQELNFFVDANNEIFVDPVCLADNFPDGNALTSQLFGVYNNVLMLLNYALPLVVLIFTYGRVVMVLRKSETIGDTRHQENINAKRRAANMLALVVFIFMFLWFPYQLYFSVLYNHLGANFDRKTSLYIYLNIYWLGMSSTVFNPIIYYFMNESKIELFCYDDFIGIVLRHL
ncbi:Tachykinin-like peptides receptor 99D [Toxocara canis]|uniref:Tachykinin-like peptides receptor 99D n=1 Tax=Toxocara canis TaxID=6265 RepID=A0A0B2V4Q7_TOXCA|nr:Tachykinin-like peptides receptor 99D [Toxocara canis]